MNTFEQNMIKDTVLSVSLLGIAVAWVALAALPGSWQLGQVRGVQLPANAAAIAVPASASTAAPVQAIGKRVHKA